MEPVRFFVLPEELPQNIIKKELAKKNRSDNTGTTAKATIEQAISHLFAGQIQADNTHILLHFVRKIARDELWVQKNKETVRQVMRALSICYVLTEDVSTSQKIRQIISKHQKILCPCILPDLTIRLIEPRNDQTKIAKETHSSALVLGCTSPVFDRMLRGNFQEACQLKETYKNGRGLPEITVRQSPVVFELYNDIVMGRTVDGLNTLSADFQTKLIRYFEMNDALGVLLKVDVAFVFRNLTPDIVQRVYDYFCEEKKLANRKAKIAPFAAQIPDDNLEDFFLKHLIDKNASVLYQFAKEKTLNRLAQQALHQLVAQCSMMMVLKGIIDQEVEVDGHTYTGKQVCEACINWFIRTVAESGQVLKNNSSKEKKGILFSALNILKPKRKETPYLDLLINFREIAIPAIEKVDYPALKTLSKEQLEWFINELPCDITEIDLSDCQFANMKLLEKFRALKVLKLARNEALNDLRPFAELEFLQELDLSGCSNIYVLDLSRVPSLRKLDVRNCKGLVADFCSMQYFERHRNLEFVRADGQLQEVLSRSRKQAVKP